jgi:uncharacterized RDD family membrane protein YckC
VVSVTSQQSQPTRAAFWRRALAFLVDGAILAVLGFVLLAVASQLLGPTLQVELSGSTARVEASAWRSEVNALLLAALGGGYFVWSWTRSGSSPGQALMRITVEIAEGGPGSALSVRRAVLRWALLGPPLGLAAAASVNAPLVFLGVSVTSAVWFSALMLTTLFSASGRGLHDRLAGSTVAQRRRA